MASRYPPALLSAKAWLRSSNAWAGRASRPRRVRPCRACWDCSRRPRNSRTRSSAGLTIRENAPLARYTRFAVGGPARVLADASTEAALTEALRDVRESGERHTVMGGG